MTALSPFGAWVPPRRDPRLQPAVPPSLEAAMDRIAVKSMLAEFEAMPSHRRVAVFCGMAKQLTPAEWAEVDIETSAQESERVMKEDGK